MIEWLLVKIALSTAHNDLHCSSAAAGLAVNKHAVVLSIASDVTVCNCVNKEN